MTIHAVQRVVGVRFGRVGKVYHFDASAYPELKPGSYVIVETARGRQLGQVVHFVEPAAADLTTLKPIKGPASGRELMMGKLWEAKEVEALITCREAASKLPELAAAKWVKADYNYDGSLLTFLYTSEEPLNTGRLRRQLENRFHARIEIRRIGARDAAKLLGEYGACGGPRCCSTYLTEFSPISIKMAKAQGISLNPSEITGMCGRLRCCLVYEYEQYIEAKKHLPRLGKQIGTPYGPGKVVDLNPLADRVTVLVGETRYDLGREQLIPLEQLQALRDKSALGCTREGVGGVCECGARIRPAVPTPQSTSSETASDSSHQPRSATTPPPESPLPRQARTTDGSPDQRQQGHRRRRRRGGRDRREGRQNQQNLS